MQGNKTTDPNPHTVGRVLLNIGVPAMMFCDIMVLRSLTAIVILYVVAYLSFIILQLCKTNLAIWLSCGFETFMIVGISIIYNFGADLHHNSFLSQMCVIGGMLVLTLISIAIARIPKVKMALKKQVTQKPNYGRNWWILAVLLLIVRPAFRVLGNTLSNSQKMLFAIIVICPLFVMFQIYLTANIINKLHKQE